VTDDLVPLDPETLTATPFPKPVSVRDPARWARLAGGWEVPEWLPPPVTVGLLPATALAGTRREAYEPSVLVFPRFAPGPGPKGHRLGPAELVARMGDNLHTKTPAPGVLAVLARLGAGRAGFAIEYGTTESALELLEKCLAAPRGME
jgi:hypothetical protein